MKLAVQSVVGLVGLASAGIHVDINLGGHGHHHGSHQWMPAMLGDARSPCPMLNTLANHNYIPRDGRNITRPDLVNALTSLFNFNPDLANGQFENGLLGNPEPDADYFDLDQLNQHNILEHDASFSRADAYFGPADTFDQAVFDQTKSYWTAPTVTTTMLANSKVARQLNSKAFNPTYVFTAKQNEINLGEVGGLIAAFGDVEAGVVDRAFLEYFFENERLPMGLGWSAEKQNVEVTQERMAKVAATIGKGMSLITESAEEEKKEEESGSAQKRSPHAGLY
ncbi:peroxidase family protein [Aspergillus lucknowensis]|uniref:Peroxidase, family 2-domain-containing protein n=1 Tax=Aspergillus lucknowensis TaxID=176173 RepID=A0ABR4LF91_9EURO